MFRNKNIYNFTIMSYSSTFELRHSFKPSKKKKSIYICINHIILLLFFSKLILIINLAKKQNRANDVYLESLHTRRLRTLIFGTAVSRAKITSSIQDLRFGVPDRLQSEIETIRVILTIMFFLFFFFFLFFISNLSYLYRASFKLAFHSLS